MPDYMFLLESRLSPEQRAAMLRVQELAAAMGLNIYLTGGTVRDLITGATLRDLDFSVEGNPSKMARELEKGGAKVLSEDEKLRQVEILFSGDYEGSISAARDDPTNGLSDIEHGEVRALTIHSFTNQPVRLLRALRLAARMGYKLESRTQEWFNLAIERELHQTITPEDAGEELRALAKEERPHLTLKDWEAHHLLDRVHPLLAKKHPDYEAINRMIKVRDDLFMAGFRPRLATPMMLAILGRLKDREASHVLSKLGFRSAEIDVIESFPDKAHEIQKDLAGRKTKTPIEAYRYIEKLPMEYVAYLLAESNNSAALSKLKAFLHKWRPIRMALTAVSNELEGLGMPRGPKFDHVVQEVFAAQLNGRGKTPEERIKMLRRLSGIKETPKKKEKKPAKGGEKAGAGAAAAKHGGADKGATKARLMASQKANSAKKKAKGKK